MPETTTPVLTPPAELLHALTDALNADTTPPALCAVALARLALVISQSATTLTRVDPPAAADAAMTAAENATALAELLKNLSETLVDAAE